MSELDWISVEVQDKFMTEEMCLQAVKSNAWVCN